MKRQHLIMLGLAVALVAAGPTWADDTPQKPAEEKAQEGGYNQGGYNQGGYSQGYGSGSEGGDILPADAAEDMEKAHVESPEKKLTRNPNDPMGFPNFHAALKEHPGVLKVDSGRLFSKKICTFAWFDSREAAKAWYFGDIHQAMLNRFYPNRVVREPMFLVDDDIPLLVAACYTPPTEPGQGIRQISIELYTPVHAGFSGGGRWGPDEWKDVYEHYDQYEEYLKEKEREKAEMGEGHDDPDPQANDLTGDAKESEGSEESGGSGGR